ncbi:MAG: N-6 DNA methylase, partial [Fastidiosipila sp.]|nr:N-6 DNA methylase [Fastidiosipila sp.]
IYNGYPDSEEDILKYSSEESLHDMFVIVPLKAHIFDPEYTKLITNAKLRNSAMLRIIDLMSLTRNEGQRNSRRGRISYADLGINQLGSVYEALLSYRGFIAEHTLYEVKRAGDSFNELDVGYFVSEDELDQYTEDERVRYERGENRGKLRSYEKGTFIYRLAGREREKSASYYTPEVLTKCLVKYALKELLEDKTADEVLNLTVCEPAMGSAAFLNEAINQLAEAYLDKKQKELGEVISYEKRFTELQKVKMFIADRNVYGIDLNPVAVELAEVSLWLNTIFEGGYVPWFGTQLVCGNSLIGARRQCYHVNQLTATAAGVRWYENAPERVPLGTKRKPQTQIYHFLLGDPGMSNYSDRVIKSLEPDKIENIKKWNKKFSSPYNDDELVTLLRLSAVIDNLWEAQVILRKKVHEKTKDSLSIYGHEDHSADSHTTIRQKDKILSELYKSERVKNAGPYARLKFAMDYWCALWFWPIDKEELLPSRSEFLFDMSLILEGTTESVQVTDTVTSKKTYRRQLSLFPTEMQQMEQDIVKTYGTDTTVDIPALRASNPRLNLAYEIAENNRFMHWELEFADLFAERDGFDLIVGNPPWVLLGWNEQAILSDNHPQFAVKNLNATQTTQHRTKVLQNAATKKLYVYEYILVSGQQSFLNATQNYANLAGMKANLYKCFLPQAWQFGSSIGVSAFVHPNGIYDDPKGGQLREKQYPRLKQHFQFENELNLFTGTNDHGRMRFSLNVYSNKTSSNFDAINNLFTTSTIEECYDDSIKGKIPGIKDDEGKWEIKGHPGRVLHITKKELKLFSHVFDGDDNWRQARLPMLHASAFVEVLERMSEQPTTLTSLGEEMYTTQMWNETQAQNAGIIIRDIHFPIEHYDGIFSGAHMGVLNPFYKCMKRVYNSNNDYDCTDLTVLPSNYYQRCMYNIGTEMVEYLSSIPRTKYDRIYTSQYRLFVRKMLNQNGERTLIGAIMPPKVGHTHGILGISFKDEKDLILVAGLFASLPYDFYVKSLGKSNFQSETALPMPLINGILADLISNRTLLLNSVSINYSNIWQRFEYTENDCWSKEDPRMNRMSFESLSFPWSYNSPLRTDYERRQALVEIDVLSSIALGTTLEQLKTIYRLQFPILVQYENDTWYDANGRIVFTINRSLNNVGFTRSEWNNGIKGAPAGKKFYRTITDDTMPGGPIERTIEYVAPFDRCDREQDYETAWAFFEEKYGKQGS